MYKVFTGLPWYWCFRILPITCDYLMMLKSLLKRFIILAVKSLLKRFISLAKVPRQDYCYFLLSGHAKLFSMLFQRTWKEKSNSSAEWSNCLVFTLNHSWWVDFSFIYGSYQYCLLKGNGVLFLIHPKFLIYYRNLLQIKIFPRFL